MSFLTASFYYYYLTVHSSTPFAPLIGRGSQLPPARQHMHEIQIWPVRLSPTRPEEVIDFEELLSELITMARMLRLHLGSKLRRRGLPCLWHARSLLPMVQALQQRLLSRGKPQVLPQESEQEGEEAGPRRREDL